MQRSDRRVLPEEPPAFDPLADVLFGAVALVFVAILSVAPEIAATDRSASKPLANAGLRFDGRETPVLLAGADGVRVTTAEAAPISLDAIADDPGLTRALEDARANGGGRVILIIEPQGGEAAFTLDPVLARAGVRAVEQIRLLHPCRSAGRAIRLSDCLQ